MISLKHLNKLIFYSIIFIFLNSASVLSEEEPADIWKKKKTQEEKNSITNDNKDITIESHILSDDVSKIVIKIDENEIDTTKESVIGIFDPEKNNFDLAMWSKTDGNEIKKILNLIFHNYVLFFEFK